MLDIEVQLRIIDLAWEWTEKARERLYVPPPEVGAEQYIDLISQMFDRAYKAILKTVSEE